MVAAAVGRRVEADLLPLLPFPFRPSLFPLSSAIDSATSLAAAHQTTPLLLPTGTTWSTPIQARRAKKRKADSLPLLHLQSGPRLPLIRLEREQLLPCEVWQLGLDLGSESSSNGVEESVRVGDGSCRRKKGRGGRRKTGEVVRT